MKILVMMTLCLVLSGCARVVKPCAEVKESSPKFLMGDKVRLKGFYAPCKGVVVGYIPLVELPDFYEVKLDCPYIGEYLYMQRPAEDLIADSNK